MRNINTVIREIKECIPREKENVATIEVLDELRHAFTYKAPEQMPECWTRLANFLTVMLGNADCEWKKAVQNIMSGN